MCCWFHLDQVGSMTERFHGAAGCSNFASAGNQMGTEDDRMIAMVLSEEYANLDGAVGRRLSHLSSIPVSSLFGLNKLMPM